VAFGYQSEHQICEACFRRGESSRCCRFLFLRQFTQSATNGILAQGGVSIDDLSDTHSTRKTFKQEGYRDARSLNSRLTAEMIFI